MLLSTFWKREVKIAPLKKQRKKALLLQEWWFRFFLAKFVIDRLSVNNETAIPAGIIVSLLFDLLSRTKTASTYGTFRKGK